MAKELIVLENLVDQFGNAKLSYTDLWVEINNYFYTNKPVHKSMNSNDDCDDGMLETSQSI